MNESNIGGLRHINVYSLPRSGTNLFAAINHAHPEIFSINVGGGRYPIAFSWHDLLKKSIVVNGEINKKRNQIRYILRDELKFGFVGKRVTYFPQFLFKVISFFRSNDAIIILLRNPYAIASSMHKYYTKKGTHKKWNMENELNIELFLKNYFNLIFSANRVKKKVLFLSIDEFISNPNVIKKYYDFLGTNFIEYSGYQELKCQCGEKFNVKENSVYCKTCGPIEGPGGLNLGIKIDTQRLRDISFLPVRSKMLIRSYLFKKFGEITDEIFCMDGRLNVHPLLASIDNP